MTHWHFAGPFAAFGASGVLYFVQDQTDALSALLRAVRLVVYGAQI